jgi:hypothetical protein
VRVQVEDGGDDGGRHDPNEDSRDDLGESGQHQQDGQYPEPDHQRRHDGAIESEREGLELGPKASASVEKPKSFGNWPTMMMRARPFM